MLTYFPMPYPGEWWYSVLCRYHVRSGHIKYATTISELYNGRPMVHGRLVPGGDCTAVLSNLPPGVLSIDDVLANHTLLPYYTRFFQADKKRQVWDALRAGHGSGITSVRTQTPDGTERLKFCPLCYRVDESKYGEPYWHRVHQIPLMPLCPTHKGMSGIASCNKELQGILNNNGRSMQFGKTTYRVNDKIILTRNNYDPKCMYFNGDIGTVQAIGNNGIELLVRGMTLCIPKSQMMDLSLSYAMTIHKSQGSEFPYPIIILPMSASHMLTRNLLYTGVTRAKKGLIIISEGKSLEMAIQTEKSTKRRTTLGELIHERWG